VVDRLAEVTIAFTGNGRLRVQWGKDA